MLHTLKWLAYELAMQAAELNPHILLSEPKSRRPACEDVGDDGIGKIWHHTVD